MKPSPIVLSLLVFWATWPPSAGAEKPPNILFIAVDDLNDWITPLGGHPQTITPNFQRLADSGVLFTNAHCPAPACNASRTAILSGLSPATSGIYQNLQPLRQALPEAELLPRYLSRHGYWSAGSGKILHYIIDPPSWDDYFPAKDGDNPFPRTLYPENRPVSLPRAGSWQYVETDWAPLDATDEEFGGDYLVSQWIGTQLRRKHEKPFFLACGIYRPHEPWFVPRRYFEPFPLDDVRLPPGYLTEDLEDLPQAGQRLARNRYFPHIQAHGQWKAAIQGYLASIHFADAMLGRVLDALDAGPHREDTVVILWSDHGWHLGEKEHWQKFTGWRACTRVPLMVRVPPGTPGLPEGTPAGERCDRPVSLQDLFPTLTDLVGLPTKPGIDGRSLLPLLRNAEAPWPHAAITFMQHPQNYAISTEAWRYLHYRDGSEELYHIREDPYEWHNLAEDPGHAEALSRTRALAPVEAAPIFESQPELRGFKAEETLALRDPGAEGLPPSREGGPQTQVLFINRRSEPVRLFWLDGKGTRQAAGEVPKASRRLLPTKAGRVWLVETAKGRRLGHLVATARSAEVMIQ